MGRIGYAAAALMLAVSFAPRAFAQDEEPAPAHTAAPATEEPKPHEAPSAEPNAEHPTHEGDKADEKHEPSSDHAAPADAADAHGSSDFDLQKAKEAGYEIGEPTGDKPEGLGIDGKDYELPASDFEGMKGLTPEDIEALREVTPAELGDVDMDREVSGAAEKQLEKQAGALEGLDPKALDKIAKIYLEVLRKKLHQVKEKTHEKTVDKLRAQNASKLGTVTTILAWLSLTGLLLFALPLLRAKKYPGQLGKLFATSALAGGSLTLAILLLTGVLFVTRTVQNSLGEQTNPQIVLQDATFDAADENLEDIAAMPGLLMIPLQQIVSGQQDDLGVAVLENAAKFKNDFDPFKSVADALKGVKEFIGYVPIVLTGLAVVLFFLSMKDLVKDVLVAPDRAMRGEIAPHQIIGLVLKRVGAEILATLGTLGGLFVVTLATSFALGFLATPAMSTFISQLMATLEYVFVEHDANKAYVYVGLLGVLVFLMLAIVVITASGILYVGKLQKILRARFIQGVPISKHKSFFTTQTLAMLWCIALPILTLIGAAHLADYVTKVGTSGDVYEWSLALLTAPLTLVGGFIVIFVAGLGLKALLSIARYKVEGPVSDVAVAQVAHAAQMAAVR